EPSSRIHYVHQTSTTKPLSTTTGSPIFIEKTKSSTKGIPPPIAPKP
ncbi:unnamed protein product, partial [Rotaria sp. Silwood2]